MTEARKVLLIVLLPLLASPFALGYLLGPVGAPEMLAWLMLLAAWAIGFALGGRHDVTTD